MVWVLSQCSLHSESNLRVVVVEVRSSWPQGWEQWACSWDCEVLILISDFWDLSPCCRDIELRNLVLLLCVPSYFFSSLRVTSPCWLFESNCLVFDRLIPSYFPGKSMSLSLLLGLFIYVSHFSGFWVPFHGLWLWILSTCFAGFQFHPFVRGCLCHTPLFFGFQFPSTVLW